MAIIEINKIIFKLHATKLNSCSSIATYKGSNNKLPFESRGIY